jgi:predicted transcriptional regulator
MTELERLGREYKAASKGLDTLRSELAKAIVAEARAGMKQNDIVRLSGYTRERVRQICREAGIEAP